MKANIEFNQEINNLKDDLEQLYIKAKYLLLYETDNVIEKLLLLNTKESKELATDIVDTQDEICTLIDLYQNDKYDDPYDFLYDEDNEN